MSGVFDTIRPALRRARIRFKAAGYSGLRRDRWQEPDRVIAALGVREGERVADLGAGAGYFTFRLARAVGPRGEVYAVDTDSDMSSLVAERAAREQVRNVVIVAAEADDPMLPEPVDLVLTVNAFHHLPQPAPAYLAKLGRYLRTGGRVAIIEARPRWFRLGHATTQDAIVAAMTDAGYTLTARHDFLRLQSFQTFERAT